MYRENILTLLNKKTDEITESKAQDLLLSRSIKRHKLKEYVLNKISFGVPLMTEEGTFIVNGCERIVISQIIRSPNLFFRKEFGTKRKTVYTATIISNKGLWTKFVLDKRKRKLINLLQMMERIEFI
jgi:DNA-directed RNA polymerase beta subunit